MLLLIQIGTSFLCYQSCLTVSSFVYSFCLAICSFKKGETLKQYDVTIIIYYNDNKTGSTVSVLCTHLYSRPYWRFAEYSHTPALGRVYMYLQVNRYQTINIISVAQYIYYSMCSIEQSTYYNRIEYRYNKLFSYQHFTI